jgi:DNA-damage-inducible protein D
MKNLAVFEEHEIRRVYDEENETWFFSVIDVVQILIHQEDYQAARNYWKVLKNRLKDEDSESVTFCNRLKLVAADGKSYLTDVATAEALLRRIRWWRRNFLLQQHTQAHQYRQNKIRVFHG